MELKFECPTCGQHISATHAQIGVTATCPNCNAAVTVPNASTLPPPLPRPAAAPYLPFRWQGIYVDLVSLPSKPAEVEDDTEFLVTRVHSHFGEVFASVSAPVFPLEVAAFIPMFRGQGREDL